MVFPTLSLRSFMKCSSFIPKYQSVLKCQRLNFLRLAQKKNKKNFLRFPKDITVREKWLEAIGISEGNVKKNTRVCSKHFEENDVFRHITKVSLKKNKIPRFHLKSEYPMVEIKEEIIEIDETNEINAYAKSFLGFDRECQPD